MRNVKKKPAPKAAPKPKIQFKSTGKMLGVKRLAVDKAQAVKELVAPPRITKISAPLPAVIDTKTPGQLAIEESAAWYEELSKDAAFKQAVATMVGLRRVYAVAYRELQDQAARLGEELGKKGRGTMPPTTVDFAVQYAMYLASKPFDEHQVVQGTVDTILPWLATVVDRHTEGDADQHRRDRAAENEARLARPVPVGFKHTPEQEDGVLERTRAVTLVGWHKALAWLLDQVLTAAATGDDKVMVLRFAAAAPKAKDQHSHLIRLAPSSWARCAESDRTIDLMIAQYVEPTVGSPIDLLVVDDLAHAHQSGFVGRAPAAAAGDAHRRLRKWCDITGAAMIGCVPQADTGLPDVSGPEWEQLKTFTHLRPVAVEESPDDPSKYRITVGWHATVLEVAKETVDGYGGTIVLPAGTRG